MCARRFLLIVFFLTLLVVAGAFGIFQFGGQMLVKSATPKGHFAAAAGGTAPNYASVGSWLARPDMPASPAKWAPQHYTGKPDTYLGNLPLPIRPAVFYLHPTTYLERDRWNALLADQASQDRAVLFVRSQASAFSDIGDVWAPKYRQAAFGAFLLRSGDANRALDFAFADVGRAFDAFLRANPDRPLILAGHSQGSLHLLRLVAERREQLKGRVIAAYIAGWPVGVVADLPATGLVPCEAPDQTGCVLSWQSFAEPANTNIVTSAWVGTPGLAGPKRRQADMLCVNPITGTKNGRSEEGDNPGTLVPTADLGDASISMGSVAARCDDGFLLIGGAIPAMGPYVLPGNNYHVYDYALFWAAISRDAFNRTMAWQ